MTQVGDTDQYAAGVPGPLHKSLQRYLMEEMLGEDICSWVRVRRQAGKSWENIADEMSQALGLPPKDQVTQVSRQLLQKWCPRETDDER